MVALFALSNNFVPHDSSGAVGGKKQRSVTFNDTLEEIFVDGARAVEQVKLGPSIVRGVQMERSYKVSSNTTTSRTPGRTSDGDTYGMHEEDVCLAWTGDVLVGPGGRHGSLRAVSSTWQTLTFCALTGDAAGKEITVNADQVLKLKADPATPALVTTTFHDSTLAQGVCIMILKGLFTLRSYNRTAVGASTVRIRLSQAGQVSHFTRLFHADVWMFGDETLLVSKLPCVVGDTKLNVLWNE